ncbi:hypothetical protein BLNAU_1916 [Blattamonas nauphoetae]|uniref:Uncharacterized protein n=1 Tax=Blattamonas nauphoetae TaxID=2049346 RepID=A0ABQ9YGK9_9EUKA|nr:hypothetical protein BLNAU_1916 [Blattamonas nauphoetae]
MSCQTDITSELSVHSTHSAFLNSELKAPLSREERSVLYCLLVSLVRDNYCFDDVLLKKAIRFLSYLEKIEIQDQTRDTLITHLVPSPDGSLSGFTDSVCILLSSPRPNIVLSALSFLNVIITYSSEAHKLRFVQTDIVPRIISILHSQDFSFWNLNRFIDSLTWILIHFARLAGSYALHFLKIADPSSQHRHRELILQRVILPSSPYITFLCEDRSLFDDKRRSCTILEILGLLVTIGFFHIPTLEFVLDSPIVMTIHDRLSFIDTDLPTYHVLKLVGNSLREWQTCGPEVTQSGKRTIHALISEGFETTLEQMMMRKMEHFPGDCIVHYCHTIMQYLGAKVN